MVNDLSNTIMEERITLGVKMVKELAQKNGLVLTESIFIKGIEVGISLFIDKNKSFRMGQMSHREE